MAAIANFSSVDSVQLIVDSCGVPSGQIKKTILFIPEGDTLTVNCPLSTVN